MAAEGHYYKLYQAQARNVDTEAGAAAAIELPKSRESSK
jgi:ATP-binding cassette subfamily B protein